MLPQTFLTKFFLTITVLLSLFGLLGVVPVSIDTWTETKLCPTVGIVPACYVVLTGYFLMLLAIILQKKELFLTGWLPVFLLAAAGSISELLGREVCPRNAANIPLCYFSLVLALLIAVAFFGWYKSRLTGTSRDHSVDVDS